MSCIGRKSPLNEIANVSVVERLSALPSMVTDCSPLAARIPFPTGTYFNGVRSILMIKAYAMLYFSTFDTMS